MRRHWFETVDEMQTVLDAWLVEYNETRPHQGRGMNGRTPLQAFKDGLNNRAAKQKPKKEKTAPSHQQTAAS